MCAFYMMNLSVRLSYCLVVVDGKDALNWALEYPAIRSRLLMGVAMHGGNSEAFLYFRVNKWSQYTKSPLPGAGGKGPLGADDVTPTLEVSIVVF